ncbi:hypothetical protein HYQ46_009290 [Verticillium longisporum]|nr:hypothetical protein HYQ46_009290 [Verticillium longisporum]
MAESVESKNMRRSAQRKANKRRAKGRSTGGNAKLVIRPGCVSSRASCHRLEPLDVGFRAFAFWLSVPGCSKPNAPSRMLQAKGSRKAN